MKRTKKSVLAVMALAMASTMMLAACGGGATTKAPAKSDAPTTAAPAVTTAAPASEAAATSVAGGIKEGLNVQIVSKGFQHSFWRAVNQGADQAAKDFKATINFVGPESENAEAEQVQMLQAALAAKPNAICLAALNVESVKPTLEQIKADNIPVIGFDSGVPGSDAVVGNASTDNMKAGALAAEHLFKALEAQIKAATADAPVTVGVVSQDATSESIIGRTKGFVEEIVKLAKAAGVAKVEVSGHDMYKNNESGAPLVVSVSVGATATAPDLKIAAEAVLANAKNLLGFYGSNQGAIEGIINATNGGQDLVSKKILAVGFDAGELQLQAMANGFLLGSVTQDPVQIGYKAVELAVRVASGEKVTDVDTGAKFYDKANMFDAEFAPLLYDIEKVKKP